MSSTIGWSHTQPRESMPKPCLHCTTRSQLHSGTADQPLGLRCTCVWCVQASGKADFKQARRRCELQGMCTTCAIATISQYLDTHPSTHTHTYLCARVLMGVPGRGHRSSNCSSPEQRCHHAGDFEGRVGDNGDVRPNIARLWRSRMLCTYLAVHTADELA